MEYNAAIESICIVMEMSLYMVEKGKKQISGHFGLYDYICVREYSPI